MMWVCRSGILTACGAARARRVVVATLAAGTLAFGAIANGQQVEPAPQTLKPTPALSDAVQKATVDAPPATLTVSNRAITVFRATILLRTPSVRAVGAERHLEDLLASSSLGPVGSRPVAGGQVISVGSRDVLAIVPADLDPAGVQTVEDEARQAVARLQTALDEAVELRTPRRLAWAAGLSLLATATLVVLLRLLSRGRRRLARLATRAADRQLARLPGAEVVRAARFPNALRYLVTVASIAVGLFIVYSWLTFVLRRFPYSRPWGEALRGFLFERVSAFGNGILQAIPDLFTVALIVLVTRMVTRTSALLFEAVERGQATVPWVYAETAQPTRRLVSGFLWLFALALAYPYLPGSDTDAFKGVSVFIGLMISIGSSGIVNQMMSGLTITYSRALRLGDFVRIGDVEGTVIHLGSLSTKLKTPRREEITIPNSVVVSAQTTNYSRFADSEGVYAPTTVTIGYDTPWRQVSALLLMAAERTAGVRPSPPPVVRQIGLRDFYVEYVLLVCLEDPAQRFQILDRLHGHIQDAFNEHGVQIMSPNYEADPDSAKIVPPERWFASPAAGETLTGRAVGTPPVPR
jgi:small-conductance mechanosensitive channel